MKQPPAQEHINAQKERAEQIANAEQAYRNGEITAAGLLWYRTITAKYILVAATPQKEA